MNQKHEALRLADSLESPFEDAEIFADNAAIARAEEQPEQRKPLTMKQINDLPEAQGHWPMGLNDRIVRLIRAIEAAHGIKDKS
jgi:hypothetical protein